MAGRRRSKRKTKMRLAVFVTVNLLVAVILAALILSQIVFGSYKGLGKTYKIPFNPYRNKFFVEDDRGRITYDDDEYISTPGIDVSSYQGDIDWEKVKKDGIGFAMIKVGYSAAKDGSIHKDSKFSYNYEKAVKVGINTGVYFFSQAMSTDAAVKEAKYVVRCIRGKAITMPVVFDMEYTSENKIHELTMEEKTEIADAFCTIIEENGYQPMIYGNPQWLLKSVDMTYLSKYPVWLAHYTDKSKYPYDYVIWQYTDSGKVKGINKKVDMNIYLTKKKIPTITTSPEAGSDR